MTRRERILALLQQGPLNSTEIREHDGGKSKHVQATLLRLWEDGLIKRVNSTGARKSNCSFAYALASSTERELPWETEWRVRRQR